MSKTRAVLLLSVLVLQVTAAAPPRLLVVSPSDEALARAVRSAIEAHATIVDPDALPYSRPSLDVTEAVAEALERAEAQYVEARPDEALRSVQTAIAAHLPAVARLGDVSSLGRLRFWEGICLAKSGQEAQARVAFTTAYALGVPAPDSLRFPPDVLALWPSEPGHAVATQIVSVPAGASLEVDGIPVPGRTPLRVPLRPGEHIVRARKAGFALAARIAREGGRLELPLEPVRGEVLSRVLAEARGAGALDLEDPETRALIVEALGLDGRIDVTREDGRFVLARFDAQRRRLRRVVGVRTEVEPMVAALFGAVPPTRPRPQARPGVFSRWWLWASAGALVATGAALSIIVATSGQDTIRYVPAR